MNKRALPICRAAPRGHVEVITSVRRQRWSTIELRCLNRARVLFAIDAYDQEIMAWSITTGVSGTMVRDLIAAWVERLFDSSRYHQL